MDSTGPVTASAEGKPLCGNCGTALEPTQDVCPSCGASRASAFNALSPIIGVGMVLDGKWAVEDLVGQGAMGTVYLARDILLARQVAVKVMGAALVSRPDVLSRFEREARVLAQLEHPNVVPIYAVSSYEGRPFLVMKFLKGLTLENYVRAKGERLNPREILHVAKQLGAALTFMHEQGIVHRDLKPSNIMIGPGGHLTLLDLGVARSSDSNLTRTGSLIGTPSYIAPEQVLGKAVDSRADIYSFGIVLFELLTGKRPFQFDSDFEVLRAHRDLEPPNVTELVKDIPPAVGEVVHKALAKEPERRFATANELFSALEAAYGLQRNRTDARSASRTWVPVALGGAAALLVTAVIASVWSRSPPPAVAQPVRADPTPVVRPAPPIESAPPEPGPVQAAAPPVVRAKAPRPKPKPPEDGQLRVVTRAGNAMAWSWLDVDGERRGPTPLTLTLSAGMHDVRISQTGYRQIAKRVRIEPGQMLKLEEELGR